MGIQDLGPGAQRPGCEFVLAFALVSRRGALVGDGTGCITSIVSDCPNAVFVGCRETVLSTLTFNFAGRGSLTAPSTFKQVWVSDTAIVFRSKGKITNGTDEFAAARGSIKGHGTIDFAATQPDAAYVVRVREDGDADDD